MAANWYRLGLQLSLTAGTLDTIRARFSDPIDQLLEMLKTWLKAGDSLSWKTLTDALRSRTVGAIRLARTLEAKYCLLEGTEAHTSAASRPETIVIPPLHQPETIVIPPLHQPETIVIPPLHQPETIVIPPLRQPETIVIPPLHQPETIVIPPLPVSQPVASQSAIVAALPGQLTAGHTGMSLFIILVCSTYVCPSKYGGGESVVAFARTSVDFWCIIIHVIDKRYFRLVTNLAHAIYSITLILKASRADPSFIKP